MNQEFDRMLGEGDFLIFYFPPPSRRNVKGSSPSYFPVIDQPSALTSQRTDGVLQLRFECCFVLKSITRDEESSAKNRVFSARIAHQIIFRTHIKRAWFSRKPPVKLTPLRLVPLAAHFLHKPFHLQVEELRTETCSRVESPEASVERKELQQLLEEPLSSVLALPV